VWTQGWQSREVTKANALRTRRAKGETRQEQTL
jgi:hypothetical protein